MKNHPSNIPAWVALSNPAQAFGYDLAGNLTDDGVNRYAYDSGGRLTQTTAPSGTTLYQADALGRRVKKTSPSGQTTYYHYDPEGRLVGESGQGGRTMYKWHRQRDSFYKKLCKQKRGV